VSDQREKSESVLLSAATSMGMRLPTAEDSLIWRRAKDYLIAEARREVIKEVYAKWLIPVRQFRPDELPFHNWLVLQQRVDP